MALRAFVLYFLVLLLVSPENFQSSDMFVNSCAVNTFESYLLIFVPSQYLFVASNNYILTPLSFLRLSEAISVGILICLFSSPLTIMAAHC